MRMTDDREVMSCAAARTCWQTGQPAGVVGRWTPALSAGSAVQPEGRPVILGQIAGVDVRISLVGGRYVVGQAQTDGGRQGWWYHVTNAATLAEAHAAAWRILQPMEPRDGVLAQLAADKALDQALGPGWRK